MATTLNAVTLPDDSIWKDEFEYAPISQNVSVTLGGRQIIEETARIKGRPITLYCHWLDKLELDALVVERDTLDNTMTLTLDDGRVFSVRFKQGSRAIDAKAIIDRPSYLTGDYFETTIKLFEV